MPVFSNDESRLKMVILTKHGIDNEVWWSPIKQNTKRNEKIIEGMLRRFKKHRLAKLTNVVQFYEGHMKIDQYRL